MNGIVLARKISDVGRVGADSAKNYSKDISVIAFRKGVSNKVAKTGYSGITFRRSGKLRELNLNANVVVLSYNWKLIEDFLGYYPGHNILGNLAQLMSRRDLRL